MKTQALFITAAFATALIVAGCNENPTSPETGPAISLSIAAQSSGSAAQSSGTLTLESAKVLLKRIQFHRYPSNDSSDIKTAMIAVPLNLNGPVNTVAASNVPAGQYDRIKFRIHKPEDTEPIPDPEFREGASGDLRYSVIVRGTHNGRSFVFKSREVTYQEIRFATPITVGNNQTVNVTLVVDPASWFMRNGAALDPADESNRQRIDEAIKESFRNAVVDNNRDGRAD